MGCSQAEILRLLELIEDEVISKAKSIDEARKLWKKLKLHLRELSLDDLRRELMI